MPAQESNKAKIAKRVIEVLDFFDDSHPTATVMDIVRRYDRPQSSTSELLSTLVELGILYKDNASRSYTLTPRAAILGTTAQPNFMRDGRLNAMIDRLTEQTQMSVGVFGMVGVMAQVFGWRNGEPPVKSANAKGIGNGTQDYLTDSTVGHLLLSTLAPQRREGLIRRLNAEAPDHRKFNFAEMNQKVVDAESVGSVDGTMGFGSIADVAAILIPGQSREHPLALGIVYEPSDRVETANLIALLKDTVQVCFDRPASNVVSISHAA